MKEKGGSERERYGKKDRLGVRGEREKERVGLGVTARKRE